MKRIRQVQGLVVVLLVVIGLAACNDFQRETRSSPTVPTEMTIGDASPANFWVGVGGNRYFVSQEDGSFSVIVPQGVYLLQYQVRTRHDDGTYTFSGYFYVLFEAEDRETPLSIGLLPGDEIWNVILMPGTLLGTPTPVIIQDGLHIFVTPEDPLTYAIWVDPVTGPTFWSIFQGHHITIIVIEEGTSPAPLPPTPEEPTQRYDITSEVTGGCDIRPPTATGVPHGASRSFKIVPLAPNTFDDILEITVNDVSMMPVLQELGSGIGHLVIHDITEDLLIEMTCTP